MSAPAAFPFDATAFLNGPVATCSPAGVGAYLLLLVHDWTDGGLPTDGKVLANLCRLSQKKFSTLWGKIQNQFFTRDGKLYHYELDKERRKQELWRAKSAAGGRASAARRARVVQPPLNHPSKGGSTTLPRVVATAVKQQETARSKAIFSPPVGAPPSSSADPPGPPPTPTAAAPPDARAPRSPPDPVARPDELAVLQHYLAAHPRRRYGPKDIRCVRTALAMGFSAADLCEAIDGNAADAWHQERHKHELPYVLRDAGTIDQFRETLVAPRPPPDVFPRGHANGGVAQRSFENVKRALDALEHRKP